MTLARRQRPDQSALEWAQLCSEEFVFSFSSLLEFLCRSEWEEGVARSTGTAMVLLEEGTWKVWLHDRDGKESLWVSGPSLEAVLLSCEGHLREGTGEWRRDRPAGGQNGRRRS